MKPLLLFEPTLSKISMINVFGCWLMFVWWSLYHALACLCLKTYWMIVEPWSWIDKWCQTLMLFICCRVLLFCLIWCWQTYAAMPLEFWLRMHVDDELVLIIWWTWVVAAIAEPYCSLENPHELHLNVVVWFVVWIMMMNTMLLHPAS
jgi:hypothetical protein